MAILAGYKNADICRRRCKVAVADVTLIEKIGEAFPDVEIEVHYGGQPIYYYVISVE